MILIVFDFLLEIEMGYTSREGIVFRQISLKLSPLVSAYLFMSLNGHIDCIMLLEHDKVTTKIDIFLSLTTSIEVLKINLYLK